MTQPLAVKKKAFSLGFPAILQVGVNDWMPFLLKVELRVESLPTSVSEFCNIWHLHITWKLSIEKYGNL